MGYSRIKVDTVYQKVLALANKERRGYITPQEFNLFADQAQQDIFDNYFHDLRTAQIKLKNNTGYSDEIEVLESRISMHKVQADISTTSTGEHDIPGDLYSISSLAINNVELGGYIYVERVEDSDLKNMLLNPLTNPSSSRPVYVEKNGYLKIYPATSQQAQITYTARPGKPNWAYIVVNGKAMFNQNEAVDFDMHVSEENNLVIRILQLAGISTEEQFLTNAAYQDAANTEAKKNN